MCGICAAEWPALVHPGTTVFTEAGLKWQCIGVKGLKIVCSERGLSITKPNGKAKNQAELVATLQTCEDFAAAVKAPHEKAAVTEMMKERGHVALFGVKYHAELAHVERKWMWLKQKIRPRLNGKVGRLQEELGKWFPQFQVADARRAARHC